MSYGRNKEYDGEMMEEYRKVIKAIKEAVEKGEVGIPIDPLEGTLNIGRYQKIEKSNQKQNKMAGMRHFTP